jgi:hypothetical protein
VRQKGIVFLPILIIILLIGVVGYFGYQNLKLKKDQTTQPVSVEKRTELTNTNLNTQNWTTFTNSKLGFQIMSLLL